MSTEQTMGMAPRTPGFRMIRTLGAIAMLSGLLVVLVYQFTKPIIAENQRIAIEQAVFKVVPGATRRIDLVLSEQGVSLPGDAVENGVPIYVAFDDRGNLKGVAMAAGAQG